MEKCFNVVDVNKVRAHIHSLDFFYAAWKFPNEKLLIFKGTSSRACDFSHNYNWSFRWWLIICTMVNGVLTFRTTRMTQQSCVHSLNELNNEDFIWLKFETFHALVLNFDEQCDTVMVYIISTLFFFSPYNCLVP